MLSYGTSSTAKYFRMRCAAPESDVRAPVMLISIPRYQITMSFTGRRKSLLARSWSKDAVALVRGLPFAQLRSTAHLHERLADQMLLINAPAVCSCASRRSRKQQIFRPLCRYLEIGVCADSTSGFAREFRTHARG